jgi:tetratricopeptide (TPR) repeat protein
MDSTDLMAAVHVCREAGEYLRADRLAGEGVAAAERAFGPDSGEVADLLAVRGVLCRYLGRFADSEQHYLRALAIHTRSGSDRVAAVLHNLGGLAHERGDHDAAYAYALRGLTVRAAFSGPDSPAVARDGAALAAILVDLCRYDEAEELLAGTVATYERCYGPRHHEIGVALHNLGCLRYRRDRFGAAAATLRRAHEIKRAVLGDRHPDLAVTLYARARCATALGDRDSAVAWLRAAVDLLDGIVSPDQPTLSACRAQLGTLLGEGSPGAAPV